jgi:hypothetical protein
VSTTRAVTQVRPEKADSVENATARSLPVTVVPRNPPTRATTSTANDAAEAFSVIER